MEATTDNQAANPNVSVKKTQKFQAEIQELLNIVVHSLYSKKEIFLRELISNASDALDKRKFLSKTQPELAFSDEPGIWLIPNDKEKTLKIRDNGIGMSFQEVEEFIGTVARSGTKKFVQMSEELKKSPELIGQFGVGFYSSFMVADKVQLHTQKADSDRGVLWESDGSGQYTISEVPRPEGAGTTIFLKFKKTETEVEGDEASAQDFSDPWILKDLVKKHSDFIAYPIYLVKTELNLKEDKEKQTEVLNSQKALWLKPASEITDSEYQEFYKHLTHDWQNPSKWIHFRAEGQVEFTGLFFIPEKRPWNFHYKDYDFGLSLYIKKVLIIEKSKDLLPSYLRFVRGLVDSNDLSLNVSRELLQQDRQVQIIRKGVVNKILGSFKEWLQKDRVGYEKFYTEFGSTLKEGIAVEPAQKEKLAEILLFKSVRPEDWGQGWVSLAEVLERKKANQTSLFYLLGEDLERARNNAILEKFKERAVEVLLLTDPVDEWMMRELTDYKGVKFRSVQDSNLDLEAELYTPEEKEQREKEWKELSRRFESMLERLKNSLRDQVKSVVLSKRLTRAPSCLVAPEGAMSEQAKKLLKQLGQPGGMGLDEKRVLELNPKHPMVERMLLLDDGKQAEWAELLYYQARIQNGEVLENPQAYTDLLGRVLGVDKSL
jgi:molecular chaperone HtpG